MCVFCKQYIYLLCIKCNFIKFELEICHLNINLFLQMKHIMGMPFPLWQSEGISPIMNFKGMSMSPRLGDPVLTPSVATSNSASPVPSSEISSALELAKSQDLPSPLPIPQGRRAPGTTEFTCS